MRSANTELVLSGLFICLCAMGCKGRSLGGGERPSPCIPGVCQGCCGADGRCHPGTSDYRCGVGGERCADCGTLGGSCEDGVCIGIEECGPSNCTGCCNESGNCVDGVVSTACGSGGDECVDCGELVCEGGGCVEGCRDLDGDGYGPGCELGEDCDDLAPGIVGRCQENGCPQGWAFVPAGEFLMGCNDPDNITCDQLELEIEPVILFLDSFCVEVTEVSVASFRECVEQGICDELAEWQAGAPDCNWNPRDADQDRPNHPMNCLEWVRARQYCTAWLGGDLPSEKEWEKAARGTDGRWYPWGNTPDPRDCDRCNYSTSCYWESIDAGRTWPVGYLQSQEWDSPYGLKDVLGNVLELTRSRLYEFGAEVNPADEDNVAAARGDFAVSAESAIMFLATYYRSNHGLAPFGEATAYHGFRCVRSLSLGR